MNLRQCQYLCRVHQNLRLLASNFVHNLFISSIVLSAIFIKVVQWQVDTIQTTVAVVDLNQAIHLVNKERCVPRFLINPFSMLYCSDPFVPKTMTMNTLVSKTNDHVKRPMNAFMVSTTTSVFKGNSINFTCFRLFRFGPVVSVAKWHKKIQKCTTRK